MKDIKDQPKDPNTKQSSKSMEKKAHLLVNDQSTVKMPSTEKTDGKLPAKKESKKHRKKERNKKRKKRKKPKRRFITETKFDVESIIEVPTPMEGKAGWRKANIKTKWLSELRRHQKEDAKEDVLDKESTMQRPCQSRICWQRANLKMQWMSLARIRKRMESKNKMLVAKPPSKPPPMEGKVSWQKSQSKIRGAFAWKKRDSKSEESEIGGDLGKSKFVLENLPFYTVHPDLLQYYAPLKVNAWDKIFAEDQRIKRYMTNVTEYDQNKTLLIMTNNPPPSPVNWQGKDKPPCYFSKELLAEPQEELKPTALLPLKRKKKKKFEYKTPFPVVILKDSKPKREQWYRFATQTDFKAEPEFSRAHILRKQQKMYPELSFAPDFRAGGGKERQRKISLSWEPLTLSSLLEVKPTLTLPLTGKKPFRFGRAPQWFINMSSTAP